MTPNYEYGYEYGIWDEEIRNARRRPTIKYQHMLNHEVKQRTWNYSYSNPASQGALIADTGFPTGFNDPDQYSSAYSDRIGQWDHERLKAACKIAGSGDQCWAYQSWPTDKLIRFAQVALNLPVPPKHVRLVHYFNVSNGYSCPVVEAIYTPPASTP